MSDFRDVDATLQAVRLQLFRENIGGALDLVEAAHAAHPDPRYAEQAAKIRGWLTHLGSREAYVAAQEGQYSRLRWRAGLKLLEKRIRILLGRKTKKLVERRGRNPEFVELEREIVAVAPRGVLHAGCGEGGVAMAVAARHPTARVEGVEASLANVRLARQLNRLPNAAFRQGLAEEVHLAFPPGSFDLVYSFAVLEHVRDVDATLTSILTVLRRGGRFCFGVPMHEFRAMGPLPEYTPIHGYADHCRVSTEAELRARFGKEPDFRLAKIPGRYKPGEFPATLEPVEFGSFFVAFTKR
ncbi:MAG TPA: class I SAM-dependent methyltransferase [Methylomirabilota bacterium]|nr:class I SAM-dependent methyltransferase [Methylomirabilota bacterium]